LKEKNIVAGLLLICCTGLVALLSFKGFNKPVKVLAPQAAAEAFREDFKQSAKEAKEKLSGVEKSFAIEQEGKAESADTNVAFEASRLLITLWDSVLRYDLSGYYYKRIAEKQSTEFNWMNTAQRFQQYSVMVDDSAEYMHYNNIAKDAYKKAMDINPNNLEAKTMYAMSIAADRSQVMVAVPLLREVLKADSNNVLALYNLGALQMESQQLQKALVTFNKLVSLQPANGKFYFHLAEIHAKMGDKAGAISNFEKAKALAPDKVTRESIDKLIQNLKN
jgi:tetratricopeptide (TPR) repeat protein